MSTYQYISTEERVYVDRALVVSPGDVVDWTGGAPDDGHWQPTDETRAELDRLAAEQAKVDEAEQKQAGQEQPPGSATPPDTGALPADTAPEPSPAKTAARKTSKEA